MLSKQFYFLWGSHSPLVNFWGYDLSEDANQTQPVIWFSLEKSELEINDAHVWCIVAITWSMIPHQWKKSRILMKLGSTYLFFVVWKRIYLLITDISWYFYYFDESILRTFGYDNINEHCKESFFYLSTGNKATKKCLSGGTNVQVGQIWHNISTPLQCYQQLSWNTFLN